MMRVVAPLADKARAERKTPDADNPFLRVQEQVSEMVTAWLEAFGQLRDQTQEAIFHAVYGSPWLQAWLGMTRDDGRPRPKPGTSPDQKAALAAKIEELRTTMDQGGPLEAVVRALVYIAMGQRSVDARSFEVLRRILKAHPDITLARYKAIVRRAVGHVDHRPGSGFEGTAATSAGGCRCAPRFVRRDQGDQNGGRRTRWGSQASVGRDGGFVRHRGRAGSHGTQNRAAGCTQERLTICAGTSCGEVDMACGPVQTVPSEPTNCSARSAPSHRPQGSSRASGRNGSSRSTNCSRARACRHSFRRAVAGAASDSAAARAPCRAVPW